MTRYAGLAYRGMIWLFVAGVVVQVFLAGLGVFGPKKDFGLHLTFALLLFVLALVLPLAALAGRLGRRVIGLSFLILALFFLQSVFVQLRADMPYLAALHPVNALAIFWVSLTLARGSGTFVADKTDAPSMG